MEAIVLETNDLVQFEVEVDGKPVLAQISRECLHDKFSMNGPLATNGPAWYRANRARIDPVVTGKAHRGDRPPIRVSQDDF